MPRKRKKIQEKRKEIYLFLNKPIIFFLIFFIVVSLVFISLTVYNLYSNFNEIRNAKNITEFKMYLKVSNYTGFNVGTDAIYFGTIIPSGKGTRILNLYHTYNESTKVLIRGNGGLAEWVRVSDNNFFLSPYKNKTIEVVVFVPENAEFGDYEGTLEIIFR